MIPCHSYGQLCVFLPYRESLWSVEGVGLLFPTLTVVHCLLLGWSRALDIYPVLGRGRGREWREESGDGSKVPARILGAAQPRQQTQYGVRAKFKSRRELMPQIGGQKFASGKTNRKSQQVLDIGGKNGGALA